jgi:hypothetical protein
VLGQRCVSAVCRVHEGGVSQTCKDMVVTAYVCGSVCKRWRENHTHTHTHTQTHTHTHTHTPVTAWTFAPLWSNSLTYTWCCTCVTRVVPGCYSSNTLLLHWCVSHATVVLHSPQVYPLCVPRGSEQCNNSVTTV